MACSQKVKQGDWQPVYGCAPFVSHALAAGGFIPGLTGHSSIDAFDDVKHKGVGYNLNCCDSKDANPSCGGSPVSYNLNL